MHVARSWASAGRFISRVKCVFRPLRWIKRWSSSSYGRITSPSFNPSMTHPALIGAENCLLYMGRGDAVHADIKKLITMIIKRVHSVKGACGLWKDGQFRQLSLVKSGLAAAPLVLGSAIKWHMNTIIGAIFRTSSTSTAQKQIQECGNKTRPYVNFWFQNVNDLDQKETSETTRVLPSLFQTPPLNVEYLPRNWFDETGMWDSQTYWRH